MVKINPKLFIDIVYPVGSYYETSNTSFNPNTAWGGTWVEDSKGRVTVGQDTNDTDFDTIGETGGSKYLQAHTHKMIMRMGNNGGYFGNPPFTAADAGNAMNGGDTTSTGTGDSGNLQPYIVVKRWHRTA